VCWVRCHACKDAVSVVFVLVQKRVENTLIHVQN
jgi:hypothetical protein